MTVVEVVVASALLLAVLSIVLGLLVSLTTQEQRAQALVSNEQAVRLVLNDFGRDLRGADPLTVWTSASLAGATSARDQYRFAIQMQTGRTSSPTFVRWVYNPNTKTLTRQTMSSASTSATVISSQVRLTRVRNLERGLPMLQYFAANASGDSDELVANGSDPALIAACTIRIRMAVTADSQPGPEPFTESLDVHLRNRLPGGTGCPI